MSGERYPEPRRVVVAYADARRLTILERARACAVAGVAERDLAGLLEAYTHRRATPADELRGSILFYAIAWQLERRLDPGVTWEAAQTWDVALDLEAPADPVAEAEARASVEASAATGLPPAIAGELTLAQLEVYGELAEARNGRGPRSRGRAYRSRARR
jgi:hypothetical protein